MDGLSETWACPIYTSYFSAWFLKVRIKVKPSLLKPLDIGESYIIEEPGCSEPFTVTVFDANHCPGAVMFLFEGSFGRILYTGDFRYDPTMLKHPELRRVIQAGLIDTLYLDNTYASEGCEFKTQEAAAKEIFKLIEEHPENKILIGVRNLGKEILLRDIALKFKELIYVNDKKMEIMKKLNYEKFCTTDKNKSRIHCINVCDVSKANMKNIRKQHPNAIAILPTALFKCGIETNFTPFRNSENYGVYVVPYSDHSCHSELFEFVSQVKPSKLVPIVAKKKTNKNCSMNYWDTLVDVSKIPPRLLDLCHEKKIPSLTENKIHFLEDIKQEEVEVNNTPIEERVDMKVELPNGKTIKVKVPRYVRNTITDVRVRIPTISNTFHNYNTNFIQNNSETRYSINSSNMIANANHDATEEGFLTLNTESMLHLKEMIKQEVLDDCESICSACTVNAPVKSEHQECNIIKMSPNTFSSENINILAESDLGDCNRNKRRRSSDIEEVELHKRKVSPQISLVETINVSDFNHCKRSKRKRISNDTESLDSYNGKRLKTNEITSSDDSTHIVQIVHSSELPLCSVSTNVHEHSKTSNVSVIHADHDNGNDQEISSTINDNEHNTEEIFSTCQSVIEPSSNVTIQENEELYFYSLDDEKEIENMKEKTSTILSHAEKCSSTGKVQYSNLIALGSNVSEVPKLANLNLKTQNLRKEFKNKKLSLLFNGNFTTSKKGDLKTDRNTSEENTNRSNSFENENTNESVTHSETIHEEVGNSCDGQHGIFLENSEYISDETIFPQNVTSLDPSLETENLSKELKNKISSNNCTISKKGDLKTDRIENTSEENTNRSNSSENENESVPHSNTTHEEVGNSRVEQHEIFLENNECISDETTFPQNVTSVDPNLETENLPKQCKNKQSSIFNNNCTTSIKGDLKNGRIENTPDKTNTSENEYESVTYSDILPEVVGHSQHETFLENPECISGKTALTQNVMPVDPTLETENLPKKCKNKQSSIFNNCTTSNKCDLKNGRIESRSGGNTNNNFGNEHESLTHSDISHENVGHSQQNSQHEKYIQNRTSDCRKNTECISDKTAELQNMPVQGNDPTPSRNDLGEDMLNSIDVDQIQFASYHIYCHFKSVKLGFGPTKGLSERIRKRLQKNSEVLVAKPKKGSNCEKHHRLKNRDRINMLTSESDNNALYGSNSHADLKKRRLHDETESSSTAVIDNNCSCRHGDNKETSSSQTYVTCDELLQKNSEVLIAKPKKGSNCEKHHRLKKRDRINMPTGMSRHKFSESLSGSNSHADLNKSRLHDNEEIESSSMAVIGHGDNKETDTSSQTYETSGELMSPRIDKCGPNSKEYESAAMETSQQLQESSSNKDVNNEKQDGNYKFFKDPDILRKLNLNPDGNVMIICKLRNIVQNSECCLIMDSNTGNIHEKNSNCKIVTNFSEKILSNNCGSLTIAENDSNKIVSSRSARSTINTSSYSTSDMTTTSVNKNGALSHSSSIETRRNLHFTNNQASSSSSKNKS
ncbi:hypothetical protein C0J52_13864 [Blattella germanica]|nr:hypothetical protein C0J52_13864 [Blattella germanica]